jgi:hypothetical protein
MAAPRKYPPELKERALRLWRSEQGGYGASVLTAAPERPNTSPPVTGYADPNAVSQYYYVKVVNLSRGRDIWITHVWFETNPRADILIPLLGVPARQPCQGDRDGPARVRAGEETLLCGKPP